MKHLATATLVMLALGSCASSQGDPPPRQFLIEIAFQRPDGTRVVAPQLICFADHRAQVSMAKEYTYVKDYEVEVLQDAFRADPVTETLYEGVWLEMKPVHDVDQQVELQYTLRRRALKRPIEQFETTLGAFTNPVTIEIPQVISDELSGTCRLTPGVETQLVQFPVHEGVDSLTALARVSPLKADVVVRPSEGIHLDPR